MTKAKAKTGKPVGKIGEVDVWCKFDKLINTETLIENPRNPNEHSEDQINRLAIIIKYQGWCSPIVISNRSGFVIKGHCRLASARALKMLQVPVEYQDYESEASEWADLIADNIIAELATTNRGIMGKNLLALDELNFNLDLTGLDKPEIEGFMLTPNLFPDEKDDLVPEPPKKAISKTGDVWILGKHRVMCGDCTKESNVGRLMGQEKADMVFTDPPYGMKLNADYSGMKGWHQGKKYDNVIGDHADFNNDFINNIFSIFKDTKEKFLFGADYYVDLLPNYGKDGNWIVWDKRVDESKDKMIGSGFEMLWSQQKHQRRLLRGM